MGNSQTNQPAPEPTPDGAPRKTGELPAASVVAIGASAGGVQALCAVMDGLPAAFPAAVLVVLHVLARGHSMLAPILARAGALEALVARDGESVVAGRVYVAPPDVHMLVVDGCVQLSAGPPEKGARPSINVLFRSVAFCYGSRAVGVVLSGMLDDGADGLRAIAESGGTALVQDPADAQFEGMPQHAIAAAAGARVLPVGEIAPALVELVRGAVVEGGAGDGRVQGDGVEGGGIGSASKAEAQAHGT